MFIQVLFLSIIIHVFIYLFIFKEFGRLFNFACNTIIKQPMYTATVVYECILLSCISYHKPKWCKATIYTLAWLIRDNRKICVNELEKKYSNETALTDLVPSSFEDRQRVPLKL